MAVQGFLTAFDKIDTDHDHIITHEDLEKYAIDYNMPESFIKKWILLFDEKQTGSFTYEHFCDVIGLNKPNVMSPKPGGKKELKLYKCLMQDKMKQGVTKAIEDDWNVTDCSGSLHSFLIQMDNLYGVRWRGRVIEDEKNIPEVDAIKGCVMAFSPDGGVHKYVVWRQKQGGGCCACFV